MYVLVGREAGVSLEDAGNFRAFSLVTDLTATDLGPMLLSSGVGSLADSGHAWISQEWLRGEGARRGASWSQQLEDMLRFAASRGWTDAVSASVRAHIDWREPDLFRAQ